MAVNTKTLLSDSVVDLMNQAVIVSGNSYNKVDAYATILNCFHSVLKNVSGNNAFD